MGVHMFPILNPPPTSLPIPSLWVTPVHQPQASCILHRTWTGDLFLIWYYTCFNAILPNHPPPTESKRLFYISVSLLLSRIQSYHYHLSKFHIHALVYCIGVRNFLPQWFKDKESTCQHRRHRNMGLIPGSGRSPGGGNANPLQYSCLGNPMDRGA